MALNWFKKNKSAVTAEALREALTAFLKEELPRLEKLEDNYKAKHEILNKADRVEDKEDTKLVHDYPGYIVTLATGYFLGKPIGYKLQEESAVNEYKKLEDHLTTEEEQQVNFEHAENCSIFGKSYELWYVSSARDLKFKVLDPRDVFILRDDSIDKNIIAAVRWDYVTNEHNKKIYTLEVYDSKNITTYKYEAVDKKVPEVKGESKLHGFDQVPIIEILNNKRAIGDFEKQLSLINGYDEINSTSIDDMKDFTDAILVLSNMQGTGREDITAVKQDKVMLTGEGGDAKWLIKQINDTYAQNNKNRLNQDIHKFSFVPDMQDKEFAGNSSGVALLFKLFALEQLAAGKEMYFKKALNQRLNMIIGYLGLSIKSSQIQKIFTRNAPENLIEKAKVVCSLDGIISRETALSLLPFIEDVESELARIKKETEEYDDYDKLEEGHAHGKEE